jgi:hypothetical protein
MEAFILILLIILILGMGVMLPDYLSRWLDKPNRTCFWGCGRHGYHFLKEDEFTSWRRCNKCGWLKRVEKKQHPQNN